MLRSRKTTSNYYFCNAVNLKKNEYSCSRGAACGFISFNSEIFVSGERHMEFCVPELQAIKWVKDVTVRDGVITLACDHKGVKQFRLV